MNEHLLNSQPRLHSDVSVYPQNYRGDTWYLLQDETSGEQLLADARVHELLSLVQGGRTLEAALETFNQHHTAQLSPEAGLTMLATLARANLLQGELRVPLEGILEKQAVAKASAWKRLLTPFSIRIPLLDPDQLLTRLLILPRLAFSAMGVAALVILSLYALYLSGLNWSALQVHWQTRFPDPLNLLSLLLLYPIVKGAHELGHGLAARYWGAEVHEMGLMFLVFMPVPYVDASRTSAFYDSRHRMVVAGAGILVELMLTAIAMIGWHYLTPGLSRDLCFNIAIIGGVSTLLFNGNPLLRFDGYYVFADAIEIPNLATRSQRYLGYLTQKHLLGLEVTAPAGRPDEQKWLLGYALASGLYRLVIGLTIVLLVAGKFFTLGILLAGWFLFYQILRPLLLRLVTSFRLARSQNRIIRPIAILLLTVIGIPAALFTVPLPHSSVGYGVLLPPEPSLIRAKTEGFIVSTPVAVGTEVEQETLLFTLSNADLQYEQRRLAAHKEEIDARFGAALTRNRSDAASLKAEITETNRQLAQLQQDIAGLTIGSPLFGMFSLASPQIAKGRHVKKGDLLAYVAPQDGWIVETLVAEDMLSQVLDGTRQILLIPRSAPGQALTGQRISQTPMATDTLPIMALGSLAGGPIPVDASDPDGLRLLEPMFQIQVKLPEADYYIGQTFIVRFLHRSEPPGWRWYKYILTKVNQSLTKQS